MVKNLPAMQETQVQSLSREDPLEKRNGYPLQYSCLENPMDSGSYGSLHFLPPYNRADVLCVTPEVRPPSGLCLSGFDRVFREAWLLPGPQAHCVQVGRVLTCLFVASSLGASYRECSWA